MGKKMKLNKRAVGIGGTSALLALVAVGGLALPASANLIAYDGNFSGVLVDAASASYIDVADDRTSSVTNATGSRFSGRNTVSLVSFEVFSFSPNSSTGALGGANNQIDHFDRK
jgi:hypothetical protein